MAVIDEVESTQIDDMSRALLDIRSVANETGSLAAILSSAGIRPAIAEGYAIGIADACDGRLTRAQLVVLGMALAARLLQLSENSGPPGKTSEAARFPMRPGDLVR